jgi:hypothetical protein
MQCDGAVDHFEALASWEVIFANIVGRRLGLEQKSEVRSQNSELRTQESGVTEWDNRIACIRHSWSSLALFCTIRSFLLNSCNFSET